MVGIGYYSLFPLAGISAPSLVKKKSTYDSCISQKKGIFEKQLQFSWAFDRPCLGIF